MAKFKYNRRNAEYTHSNGKAVQPQTINQWVMDSIDAAKDSLRNDAQRMADKKLSVNAWRDKMREHIRAGHRNMAKLAYGPELSPKQLGRLGAIVKAQYKYLDNFVAGIKNKSVSRESSVSRSLLYLDALWATFQNELRRAKKDAGFTTCVNILNEEADNCTECPELTDKGEIPIDDMPMIGMRKCSIGCRCSIEYFRPAS